MIRSVGRKNNRYCFASILIGSLWKNNRYCFASILIGSLYFIVGIRNIR